MGNSLCFFPVSAFSFSGIPEKRSAEKVLIHCKISVNKCKDNYSKL